MQEIALFAGAQQINGVLYAFLCALLRSSIPFLVRYYQYGTPIYKLQSWESSLYTTIDVLFGTFFTTLNYMFVFSGVIDF